MIETLIQMLNLHQNVPINLNFCLLWILQFILFRDNSFGEKTSQVGPCLNPQDELQCWHHEQVNPTA